MGPPPLPAYRPALRSPKPVPLLGPPVQSELELNFPSDTPLSLSESPPGSNLSGSGFTLAASPTRPPWLEPVFAYCEEVRQGAWARALHRAGCPAPLARRLTKLRHRLALSLADFALSDTLLHPELALVTVLENLTIQGKSHSRACTFRVAKTTEWQIQSLENQPPAPNLLWAFLTGQSPPDRALTALLWAAARPEPVAAFWPLEQALPVPLRRTRRRWRPPVPPGWAESV